MKNYVFLLMSLLFLSCSENKIDYKRLLGDWTSTEKIANTNQTISITDSNIVYDVAVGDTVVTFYNIRYSKDTIFCLSNGTRIKLKIKQCGKNIKIKNLPYSDSWVEFTKQIILAMTRMTIQYI